MLLSTRIKCGVLRRLIPIIHDADNYSSTLYWAEYQARESPSYHTAFLFDLSICGVKIFSNWSVTWEVIVSSADTCLILPEELFDTVKPELRSSTHTCITQTVLRTVLLDRVIFGDRF
jgi:hypothetical protein